MTGNFRNKFFSIAIFILLTPFISSSILYLFRVENLILYAIFTSVLIGIPALFSIKLLHKNEAIANQQVEKLKKVLHDNQELQKYNQIKEVMLQISYSIMNIKNMDDLMKVIVDSAVQIIDKADTASILTLNEDGLFEFKAVHGFDGEALSKVRLTLEETFLRNWEGKNYNKAQIINHPKDFNHDYMSDVNYEALKNAEGLKIKCTICTPIIVDDRIYGLINVDNINHEGIFEEEDKMIMEYLTSQLSLAFKNVMLLEKTLFLSRYDGLTKVYHRHYFDELFENLYKRAIRYQEYFCLCIMDLDNLKQVNDLYGHAAGDIIIEHFARVLKQNIRETDLLGRYGGDEFVLVFVNACFEDVQAKISVISQILNDTQLKLNGDYLTTQFSYGIACFPDDALDHKELLKIADFRMYRNKIRQKDN